MCRLNGLWFCHVLPPLEVDEYTTAPRLFASKWAIKKKRRIYNEKKAVLSGRLGDFNTGLETVCACVSTFRWVAVHEMVEPARC